MMVNSFGRRTQWFMHIVCPPSYTAGRKDNRLDILLFRLLRANKWLGSGWIPNARPSLMIRLATSKYFYGIHAISTPVAMAQNYIDAGCRLSTEITTIKGHSGWCPRVSQTLYIWQVMCVSLSRNLIELFEQLVYSFYFLSSAKWHTWRLYSVYTHSSILKWIVIWKLVAPYYIIFLVVINARHPGNRN